MGLILVEAAQQPDVGKNGELKEVHQILAEYVPSDFAAQYATSEGRAFSGTIGRAFSRTQFIEWYTNPTVVALASTGLDAPRDENDLIMRPQLISTMERELKVLWGEIISRLGTIDQADLTVDSPTAARKATSVPTD